MVDLCGMECESRVSGVELVLLVDFLISWSNFQTYRNETSTERKLHSLPNCHAVRKVIPFEVLLL